MAKARKMNRGIVGKTSNHPDNTVKIVCISLGHIISSRIGMQTFCGTQGFQWKFGKMSEVDCNSCIELYETTQSVVKK